MSGYGAFVQHYHHTKWGWGKRTIFFCNKCKFRTISLIKIMNHMKIGHHVPLDKFLGEVND